MTEAKTLEEEFSSFYDAQGTIELMHKNNPDLIVEPYVRLSDSCEIEISSLGMDKLADCCDGQDSDSLDPEAVILSGSNPVQETIDFGQECFSL